MRHKNSGTREFNAFSGIEDNNPPYIELVYYEGDIPELDIKEYRMPIGNTLQLSSTVLPSYATETSITWTLSNYEVVTVDERGMVTALGIGTATITATTNDGGFTANAEIDVANYKTLEWNFSEWGAYTSSGTNLSSDYTLGNAYDYNGLTIVFSNSLDRINYNTWGIFFRYAYSSSNSSYVAYTPEFDGTLTFNGKAFKICEGSPTGAVVGSNTSTTAETDILIEVKAGTTYYAVSTANSRGRIIHILYEHYVIEIGADKTALENVIAIAAEKVEDEYTIDS